ncbi:outer membrane lipoprotein-sorting protein [Geomonas propionica]|uniref:Outer membrane lipoprotein-sorting protein n=1 Tax=Geomonas propionica TaxID=2798582 RepID=A0ABS0YW41_9BACT|nr:outer membrane lipoprotein-sorting protein [Geomonas propionica]MBJ6802146.1 outer membrane lipoprotein-sorting protein [Geomonas propionica]
MTRKGFKPLLLLLAAALLLPLPSTPTFAGTDARSLLKESESRHRTKTQQYSGDLTVVNKEGKIRKKGWNSYRQGYAGDSKNLIRFTDPPEVKGVGFLSLPRPGSDNPDQWLYLPSMKRERRIAPQDRDASFVGTDFNYEDMEEFDHEKYKVSLQGEETVGGQPCWVITAIPLEKGSKSIYQKLILYLRKDILYLVREDLIRKGDKEPAKRLILSDIKNVEGHYVAARMEMTDLKKGSHTTVTLKQISFNRPQPTSRFTLQNLTREGGD